MNKNILYVTVNILPSIDLIFLGKILTLGDRILHIVFNNFYSKLTCFFKKNMSNMHTFQPNKELCLLTIKMTHEISHLSHNFKNSLIYDTGKLCNQLTQPSICTFL